MAACFRDALRGPGFWMSDAQYEQALDRAVVAEGTFGKARELAHLDAVAFAQLLGERSVDRHHGPDELEETWPTPAVRTTRRNVGFELRAVKSTVGV